MGVIKQVFKVEELPSAWGDELKRQGYVNKRNEVCLTFAKPEGVDEEEEYKSTVHMPGSKDGDKVDYDEPPSQYDVPPGVASRLKRSFADNKAKRPEHFRKSGRLSHKHVGRVAFSNRVFDRAQKQNGKSYYMHVVVDTSGSMKTTDPASVSYVSAMNLVRDLQTIGVQVQVTGFDTRVECVHPFSPSRFSKVYRDGKIKVLRSMAINGGGTDLQVALIRVLRDINAVKDAKAEHIVVVLTDGFPDHDVHTLEPLMNQIKKKAALDVALILTPFLGLPKHEQDKWMKTIEQKFGYVPRILPDVTGVYEYLISRVKGHFVAKM